MGIDEIKAEVEKFLDKNKKSFERYETQEGAFDTCRKTSYAVAQRLQGKGFPVRILRAEDYNGSMKNAHQLWKNLGPANIIHYVIELNNELVLDLTSKQFNPENPVRFYMPTSEFKKLWEYISIECDFSQAQKPKP